MIDVLPIVVHVEPFDDSDAVNVLPLRWRRTQRGGVDADPVLLSESPPVVGRHCKATPFAADTSANACFEDALSVSRTITPAFDQVAACWTLATRA